MTPVNKSFLSNSINWVRNSYSATPGRVILIAVASLAALAKLIQVGLNRYSEYKISKLPTTTIKFATWNVGGTNDFRESIPKYPEAAKPSEWANNNPANLVDNALYNLRISLIGERINQVQADVFALQEIHQEDLKRLSATISNNSFSVISDDRDSAILYRNDRFLETAPTVLSRNGRFGVLATLEDRVTHRKVTVGSTHIAGFRLASDYVEQPFGSPNGREYHAGDRELADFVNALNEAAETQASDLILLGMDANTNATIHPERLGMLEPAGFQRDSSVNDGKTTAYNRDLGEVQLDHICSRDVNCTRMEFTPDTLSEYILPPSDHKVVSGTYSIK